MSVMDQPVEDSIGDGGIMGLPADEGDLVFVHQHSRPYRRKIPFPDHQADKRTPGFRTLPGSQASDYGSGLGAWMIIIGCKQFGGGFLRQVFVFRR